MADMTTKNFFILALLVLLCLAQVCFCQILQPFSSDGCSSFPDGTLSEPELWQRCCLEHDLAYWRGGTYAERLDADSALQECVAKTGETEISVAMLLGVRVGGSPWWPTSFRWGYGWPYLRGYEPLTPREWQDVRIRLAEAELPVPMGWSKGAAPLVSPNVPNWYQVSCKLYRSAQPDADGFREIAEVGITTVLNLRAYHSDDDEAAGTDLKLVRVRMQAFNLHREEVVAALRAIRQASGPVLVHCLHGADRTGTVVAMYRIVEQGWSKEAAIAEMTGGGFGYHPIFPNLLQFIRQADVDQIRAELDGNKTGGLSN